MSEQGLQAEIEIIRGSGLFMAEWYLASRPDLPAGTDALAEFCFVGWRENAAPNPYFSPAFYLAENRDIAAAGINPLLHYATHGDFEGRDPCFYFDVAWYRAAYGLGPREICLRHFLERRLTGQVNPVPVFDAAYYLDNNPDVAADRADPFEHFQIFGAAEGRNPAAGFDMRFYVNRYGALLQGQNPLLHYLANRESGRFLPMRPVHEELIPGAVKRATRPSRHFEDFRPLPAGATPQAKMLAFYLPQFHAAPENDAWWGKGFTDWTNLARALPRYVGHLQPRVPRDLGYYSLDDPAILRRQVALALGAGLHGFVFYFYWFNGTRLLDAPLEQFLGDASLKMPFCVMWANENWTRRWDGLEREILIAQEYRPGDDAALIAGFARLFADPRYIRVQNRPLLMIYRITLVPDAAARLQSWRAMFRRDHGENPIIIMAQSLGDFDPIPYGLDGAVEFPPHKLGAAAEKINETLDLLDPDFAAAVYDYEDIAKVSLANKPPAFPLIKTIVPGWDNDPRREGQGLVLHDATPEKYRAWLEKLVDYTEATPFFGERIICVNAWNEWAEGAFLEPDIHFGAAFLNATGAALCRAGTPARPADILLVGHDAHPHGAQLLLLHLARQLRSRSGMNVHLLLLGVGPLLGAYNKAATVNIAYDQAIIGNLIDKYRDLGIKSAIVNSAASARVIPLLAARGIAATLLVHEMPQLLREYNLQVQARLGATAAARTIFASDLGAEAFFRAVGLPAADFSILPQGNYQNIGFDPKAREAVRRRLGIEDAAFLVLGVGFGDLRKGFDLFLQMARKLAARADMYFIWVGEIHAALKIYLEPEMIAAGAQARFRAIDFTADVQNYYAAADIYALTSREDPYPTTVLEAIACGVPCVAFAQAGGIPDLLRRLGAGLTAPLGDLDEFIARLETLADHERLEADRQRLIALAAEAFSFPRYVDRLLTIAVPALRGVSVCVISYNYAHYLPARLGSIFAQTYPVREVLFLDDASTDESVSAAGGLAEQAGRQIEMIVNRNNSGSIFLQWRRAAETAQGEYIWIAEADDDCAPDFLEKLVTVMQAAEAPLLAFADSVSIDETGSVLSPSYAGYYAESGAAALSGGGVWPAAAFAEKFLSVRNLILNVSAVLWRREALLAALDACTEELADLRIAGDWRLYLQLLARQAGSVVYVNQPLNHHRRHQEGATQRLDATAHLAEIGRLHKVAAQLLNLNAAAGAAQHSYREMIASQFGAAARPQPEMAIKPEPETGKRLNAGAAIVARSRKV